MKAAVCHGFGQPLTIEDIALADPGHGEIKVKIAACAICHSDIFYADGAWGGTLPAVYGHEAAGHVEAVGPGVQGLSVGDPVVVTLIRACGTCRYCARNEPVQCDTEFPLDRRSPLSLADGSPIVHGLRTGAFAESVVVDDSQAVAIDPAMPMESASLLACGVITGYGAAVNTAEVAPGMSVVVIGTGGVGLNSVQGARIAGADPVIAVDLSDMKLEAARRFGATHTVNPTKEDAAQAIRSLTGGHGADTVIVTVGAKPAFDMAFGLLARGGAAVLVGMPPSGVMTEIDPSDIASANHRILGCKMGSARIAVDIPHLVGLYREGRLLLDELITGRYGLGDINSAIDEVKRGDALRNVILF